jgi:hypothetical protein
MSCDGEDVTSFLEQLKSLDEERRRAFYHRFWFELTITGRMIWADEALADAAKLQGLKSVNELQHRTWHAHAGSKGCDVDYFWQHVNLHANQSRHAHEALGDALSRAMKRVKTDHGKHEHADRSPEDLS